MKKRIVSVLCAILLIMSMSCTAVAAEPRASYYFGYTSVRAYAEGGGEILIEFDINATHTMEQVGAKRVYIFEQQSDGSYEHVYTFYSDSTSGMMNTNSAFANGDIYYQGTSGVNYYAKCALYAKDSSGSETMYVNSNIVTA